MTTKVIYKSGRWRMHNHHFDTSRLRHHLRLRRFIDALFANPNVVAVEVYHER